jgi:hypothetical protein
MAFIDSSVTALGCRKGRAGRVPPTAIFGFTSILFAILLVADSAKAIDWYVRPAAQGGATGKDWNNAWSISGIAWGSVNAGDTIWLAGGSYSSGITVSASGAAGNPINIKKVLSSDSVPARASGWNSAFDSQVQLPGNIGISIPSSSHIAIDGRIQYGILIKIPFAGGYGVECDPGRGVGKPVIDLTFKNIDILGPYASVSNPAPAASYGFKISPSDGTLSNVLIDHCRIRGCPMGLHCLVSNLTVQYSVVQDVWPAWGGTNSDHPDVMYCYPSPNMIWRYNSIINCEADGMFFEFGGADHFYFYGNVYYNTTNHMIFFKNGSSVSYGPFFIYNNTFHAPGTGKYQFGYLSANGSSVVSGSRVFNNIFYNTQNSFSGDSGVASDYNSYNYTSLGGYSWPSNEAHSFTFSSNPFVQLPAYTEPVTTIGNFHLTSASQSTFQNGFPLANDGFINFDMDRNQRGSGGHWYIGAYQSGSGNPMAPAAPTDLHVVSSQ